MIKVQIKTDEGIEKLKGQLAIAAVFSEDKENINIKYSLKGNVGVEDCIRLGAYVFNAIMDYCMNQMRQATSDQSEEIIRDKVLLQANSFLDELRTPEVSIKHNTQKTQTGSRVFHPSKKNNILVLN
ncbi:hypothetical protein JK635_07340 [Neobacillus sp. YIM B02564]|uniref:DUF1320 domain-containing protein n=1 Tax=Neobacillus paridis TaxID=2803862 RepID=A0ABS1TL69_9BACI|nr:hypothetical protein [Neobacillus paridis]MBL4952022.1 hypothetical protein [Neobacillus paridis]